MGLLSGCNQILGISSITLGDAGTHGGSDSKNTACVTGNLISPCFPALPTMDVTINAAVDTDHDPRCVGQTQTGGPDVCIIGGMNLTVAGTVHATGSRPLVLVAVMDLNVNGALNVQGTGGSQAAGAGTGACNAADGGNDPSSPGGGGGGGFGTPGAGGGNGQGTGGQAGAATANPPYVRGGCPGGKGGNGSGGQGLGGIPGGAVYMIGGNSVNINSGAQVLASGGGGAAGPAGGGAGGGGASGGLVGLDSPNVVGVDGNIIADGGGGGGGANSMAMGGPGQQGTDTSATGGNGASGAGSGGNGGVNATAPSAGTSGTAGTGGGGGGGGSVGIVWLSCPQTFVTGEIVPDTTGPP